MKNLLTLGTGTALSAVLCASMAQADVTADQIWKDWSDYYTSLGQKISAETSNKEGDTLVLGNVKLTSTLNDGSSEAMIPQLRMKEMGDGTVEITLSEDVPMTIHTKSLDGKANDIKLTFHQSGMNVKASGTPDSLDYDYAAPEISVNIDDLNVDGTSAPVKLRLTNKNVAGQYHTENSAGRSIASKMKIDTMDVAISGADPKGEGTFNLTGALNGLTGTGTMTLPEKADMNDMNAAMQAGMAIDGSFNYTDGAYKIEATGPQGAFTADTSALAGTLNVKLSKDGIAYGGASGETKLALSGAAMPFPVDATIAESAFNFAIPVSKSDTPMPAALLIKLVDLKVSDSLWNMVDPTTKLPHDPATLVIDLSGAIRPLIDLFDPKQSEALVAAAENGGAPGHGSPFEVTGAKINTLQVKAVGAELTGTGDVTFDNSGPMPKPTGVVDLKATGVNKLMDSLVSMGLVPQEQMMGMRMMLGMFSVPAGDDAVTSKIEFKDGGIYANGQKLQ